jgi:hypothetical protein
MSTAAWLPALAPCSAKAEPGHYARRFAINNPPLLGIWLQKHILPLLNLLAILKLL